MLRNVASKIIWVGRATVFLVGLAVILALVLGVASTALGSNGMAFLLGKSNVASSVSTLINQGPGPALDLQVAPGSPQSPPLAVNSSTKVTNLNADKLDDKDSTDFLGKTEKATDSEKLDGIDSSGFAKAYKRTVVVSPVGTNIENGTALLNAVRGITDASASKPYLVKIEPGVYDLGLTTLPIRPFVSVEGSGQFSTKLIGSSGQSATVQARPNTELRSLTVENTVTGTQSLGVWAYSTPQDQGPFRMTHVTVSASGGESFNTGVLISRLPPSSVEALLSDSTITASGGDHGNLGVTTDPDTLVTLNNVIVSSRDADVMQPFGSSPGLNLFGNTQIKDSQISSDGPTIVNRGGGSTDVTTAAIATRLNGPPAENQSGTLKCAGVFDEDYRFFAETCP